MKKVKDRFSKQAASYKKYRPAYPQELYDEILDLTLGRDKCWDCGTGNGQVAVKLSGHFKKVFATDISEGQITKAPKKGNIFYSVQRAERTNFEENKFDLVTVAQAVHWFDIKAFNMELHRVVKNSGLVYVWGYGLLRIDKVVDKIIDDFYSKVVGRYWDEERRHVEDKYISIALDFTEIKSEKEHRIETLWKLDDLKGYLNSWSGVQNFISKNDNNPVNEIIEKIKSHWKNETPKEVEFPIFTRIGRIEK